MNSHIIYFLSSIGLVTCLIMLGFFVVMLFAEARKYTRRHK
jgi:hypothetical protein